MQEGQRWEAAASPAASRGVVVAAGTPAHTKGSWITLLASTAFDSTGVLLNIITGAVGPKDWLVDIAVGAAGSEQVWIPNLIVSSIGTIAYWPLLMPVGVPADTRISARAQCTTANAQADILVCLMNQSFLPSAPLSRVTAYGANTADSGGTEIDPGTTINTKGAWVELDPAIAHDMNGLVIGIGNQNVAKAGGGNFLYDIGVGAAGSEVVIFANQEARTTTPPASGTTAAHTPMFGPTVPVSVPSGVRLAARGACSHNTATDRLMDLVVYGID
jgi:hypothetical protein